jgi:lipoprotein NlpI
MEAGHFEDAIPGLRAAIERLPADGYAPLWLYVARLRTGQGELARSELEASLKNQKDDAWPAPVARFYLGQEDAARLLADAGPDPARRAEAERLMADLHQAPQAPARAP